MHMVNIERVDREIAGMIKETTEMDVQHPEIEIGKDQDGFKRFKGLIFVLRKVEREIIKGYHGDIREGHPGESRTLEKIQRSYYFPGMYRKIRKYILDCDDCQKNRVTNRNQKEKWV
jgi:Integrase zinc binding domain